MNRLKEILKCLDLSQAEFAKRTGLSEGAISHYISGDREPTLSSIEAILRILPCKYETIWGKPTNKRPEDTREHFYGPDMPY